MISRLLDVSAARVARAIGRPASVRLMTWNVTDRCNARCVTCEIHARRASSKDELSVSEFSSFISDPLLRRIEVVRLTGGEPFLRDDLPECVDAIREHTRCRIIYVTTNGSFPERVESLVRAVSSRSLPRLHVLVSLDALDETHDRLRGVNGMQKKAIETCRKLSELKNSYDFYSGVNQTVTKGTLAHVESVNEFALKLGMGHHAFLGAQYHEGKNLSDTDPTREELGFETQDDMTREEIETFYRLHRSLKSNPAATGLRRNLDNSLLREISEEYLNEGGRNRVLYNKSSPKPPCMAAFTHFRLSADGKIYACSALSGRPLGNARENSFSRIWRGDKAAAVRRVVTKCKGCWIECDINPSIFFSGDIIPWFARRVIVDPEFRANYLKKPKI